MCFDDSARDGESHAQPFFLGREEGLEQRGESVDGYARTGIGDGNFHRPAVPRSTANSDVTLFFGDSSHCFHTVQDQIQYHLLEMNWVAPDSREICRFLKI